MAIDKSEGSKGTSMKFDEDFVWPEGTRPTLFHDQFDLDLPVVDLSPVLKLEKLQEEVAHSHEQGKDIRSGVLAEIQACEAATGDLKRTIRDACQEYGFFQIINHGFPEPLVEQLSECCRQMYDVPLEEKLKANSGAAKPVYTPFKRSSPVTKNNLAHIWNEGFNIDLPPVNYPGGLEHLSDTLWPGKDSNKPESRKQTPLFRSTLEEYGKKSSKLAYRLLDLMAASLGLPEDSVDSSFGPRLDYEAPSMLRLNHYPICTHPELTWGGHAHTDPSMITLLRQDMIGGLQIRLVDKTWHGVRPIPDAFVINVGDFLQAWTNGRFVSTEHRVVANEKQSRISMAFFAFAFTHSETAVSPRPELVDDEHPLRYKPFTQQEYLREVATHGAGLQLLDRAFGTQTSV